MKITYPTKLKGRVQKWRRANEEWMKSIWRTEKAELGRRRLQRELDGIKAEIKARTKRNKRCNIETGKEDR